uniref:Tick transposon n=1 Tax=Rhipicephalus appendiculatus TaxID=34631 RepID=A0A131YU24_RHIAP
MCRRVNEKEGSRASCSKKHAKPFIKFATCVVCKIPCSCGSVYLGQTGQCINERLRQHANSLKNGVGSKLAAHCARHVCTPSLFEVTILNRYRQRCAREIFEAFAIQQRGDRCVSVPSLDLFEKEISYFTSRA